MSSAVFHKLSGSGNDFVMLDGRTTRLEDWPRERIAAICDRRHGVGGDGLVIIDPAGPDAVRMTYFNSDGSEAPMCGNAALCSTRLAVTLEMADPAGMTLVTGAGSFRTRCVGEGEFAELNLPDTDIPVLVDIPLEAGEHSISLATVGVPHVACLVEDVATVNLPIRGRVIRFHDKLPPGGANANFVSRIAREATSGSTGTGGPEAPEWTVRTYERGIEGETLACGTGTVASALALAVAGLAELPLRFLTASGRVLSVSATIERTRATNIWLAGEGRRVAMGVWLG
ncbi:MAG TPA: diaminopimelate epimerase [Gemmatimonadales bacterium]|nr:diaminopimelate epimerase [Gemmatimonadales bacterium]